MVKIVAVVPIKHSSTRVPQKNFRLLDGKPLYHYILTTLTNCKMVDKIVVDTDSPTIKTGVLNCFPNIDIYDRPTDVCGHNVSTNLLLTNVVKQLNLDADLYLHTHTTNPLLTVDTVEDCIRTFFRVQDSYDSLFTVKEWRTRLYTGNGCAVNHDPEKLIPTQELQPMYEENSCLYVVPKETLIKYQRRIGVNPYMYTMTSLESQDIDWEDDFFTAEAIIKHKKNVKHKVVVVTGACGGVGFGTCQKFASEGWKVVGVDIVQPDHHRAVVMTNFVHTDITKKEGVDELVKFVEHEFGRVDCVVNNAAVQLNGCVEETTEEDWDTVVECNLKAPYFISQKFLPLLKKTDGAIINISSVHALSTSKNISVYATTKGGLVAMTRAMSLEFCEYSVRVNTVLPGAIDTDMLRAGLERGHTDGGTVDDMLDNFADKIPCGRIGLPADVAELVYFLSDNDKSNYITGQALVCDGGVTTRLSSE